MDRDVAAWMERAGLRREPNLASRWELCWEARWVLLLGTATLCGSAGWMWDGYGWGWRATGSRGGAGQPNLQVLQVPLLLQLPPTYLSRCEPGTWWASPACAPAPSGSCSSGTGAGHRHQHGQGRRGREAGNWPQGWAGNWPQGWVRSSTGMQRTRAQILSAALQGHAWSLGQSEDPQGLGSPSVIPQPLPCAFPGWECPWPSPCPALVFPSTFCSSCRAFCLRRSIWFQASS